MIHFDTDLSSYYDDKDNYVSLINKENGNLFKKFYFYKKILKDFLDVCLPLSVVVITVNKKCQLKCSFCYADMGSSKEDTNVVDLNSLDEFLRKYEVKNIILLGGEPLFDLNYFRDMCKIFQKYHLDTIEISTNGLNLNENVIKELRNSCRDLFVRISIEPSFFNERITKDNRHVNNISDINRFSKYFTEVFFCCVIPYAVCEKNISFDEIYKEFLKEIKFDNWVCSWTLEIQKDFTKAQEDIYIDYISRQQLHELYLIDDEYVNSGVWKKRILSTLIRLIKTKSNEHKELWRINQFYPISQNQCLFGTRGVTIAPNGDYYSCKTAASIYEPTYKLNDISSETLWKNYIDIFNIKYHGKNHCSDCISKYSCQSACYWAKSPLVCTLNNLSEKFNYILINKLCTEEEKNYLLNNNKRFFTYCNENIDYIRNILSDPVCGKILNGTIDFNEMLSYYRKHVGNISPRL